MYDPFGTALPSFASIHLARSGEIASRAERALVQAARSFAAEGAHFRTVG